MADSNPDNAPLLDVQNLQASFYTRNGIVRAVNDVSFSVRRGEILGIVGESGSGKSVTCYSMLGLIPQPPGRIDGGSAMFDGQDLLKMSKKQLMKIRGKRISMIFQDPMTSLNPFLRIQDQLIEPLLIHDKVGKKEAIKRGIAALEEVGIQDAARRIRSFPHEFSGGMRQRVMIAMALITRPDLLIADEPTTALDVTVQAQILELIQREQKHQNMGVVFITHDLGVIASICNRALVMYAGKLVESGPIHELFYNPQHPYNQALQQSIPANQKKGQELHTIQGAPPDLSRLGVGCSFAPRCEHAKPCCSEEKIAIQEVSENHKSACLRVQRGELKLRSTAAEREVIEGRVE